MNDFAVSLSLLRTRANEALLDRIHGLDGSYAKMQNVENRKMDLVRLLNAVTKPSLRPTAAPVTRCRRRRYRTTKTAI